MAPTRPPDADAHSAPPPGPLRLPEPPQPVSGVLLGLSGGLDSSVLLRLLAESPHRAGLRAIHVHHGLQAEADAWAAHCEALCAALAVPLQVRRVQVQRDSPLGLEGAAREARHAAFADALREDEALALAHHREDQAETFLMRALRASGPDGLAAMRPWRRFHHGWLWRPLLEVPRARLLHFARLHGLDWIEDPSNAASDFDRSFLRSEVMPLLRTRWPHADAAFARSAELCSQATQLLEGEDAALLQAAIAAGDPHALHVHELAGMPPERQARVLRRWIADLALPPLPSRGVAALQRLLDRPIDATPARFGWSQARVRRWRGLLHAELCGASLPADTDLPWDGSQPLRLPTGDVLALAGADRFDTRVRVRARRGGEHILLPGRSHRHTLKHVLQQRGIPPWRRERLPLLVDAEGRVLAAGDAILSARFAQWLAERDARLLWTMA